MKRKCYAAPLLAAAVMAVMPAMQAMALSPEFAHTEEEWAKLRDNVMEYEELEALVHEYNTTVRNNDIDYEDYRGKNSSEIADGYRDAAAMLYDSVGYPEDDSELAYIMSYASAVQIENQAKSLEQLADSNVDDGVTKRLQYEQAEATIASGAQSAMINYHQQLESRKVMEANLQLLQATYDSTVARAGLGMATQADVLNAQESLQNMQAQLMALDSGILKIRQNLCVMTGWRYDANPEIMAVPAANLDRVAAMNPAVDLEQALANNYTYNIDKRKLENATSSANKKTLQQTVRDDEQKVAAALNNQYNAVLQAKTAYDQAVTEYALEAKNMETAQRKYDLGMLSKLEFISQQAAFAEKDANKNSKDMALLQAIENYEWALKGLMTLS